MKWLKLKLKRDWSCIVHVIEVPPVTLDVVYAPVSLGPLDPVDKSASSRPQGLIYCVNVGAPLVQLRFQLVQMSGALLLIKTYQFLGRDHPLNWQRVEP